MKKQAKEAEEFIEQDKKYCRTTSYYKTLYKIDDKILRVIFFTDNILKKFNSLYT